MTQHPPAGNGGPTEYGGLIACRVAAGSGWPERVSASVSKGGWSSSIAKPCSRASPPSARLAAAVISGPIPWPARHATTYVRRPVIGGNGLWGK